VFYSKISRRASFDSSATASPTRVISGTTVLSLRFEHTMLAEAQELTVF
jgi:inorganic pyrophosphatase